MPDIVPWISVTPSDWGSLANAGARLTLERQQLADQEAYRRAAMQQDQEQNQAAQSLQRDRLVADIIQTKQQQDAANALRLAQLQQSMMLGQGRLDLEGQRIGQMGQYDQARIDAENQRNKNQLDYWNQQNQIRQDDLNFRKQVEASKQSNAVSSQDKFNLDRLAKSIDDTASAISKSTDQTEINNLTKLKNQYVSKAADILSKYNQKPAEAGLVAPTSTGTSGLPDLTGVPVPDNTPAAASLVSPSQGQPSPVAASPSPVSAPKMTTNATASSKVATRALIENLKAQGMDKKSAEQWLQDNGYTIPQ